MKNDFLTMKLQIVNFEKKNSKETELRFFNIILKKESNHSHNDETEHC
jgi:hypothetical protein